MLTALKDQEQAADATNSPRPKPKGRAIKTGEGLFVMSPLDAVVDRRLSHTEYRLLSLLIILSGQKGYCWPAEELLASQMVGTGTAKQEDALCKQGAGLRTLQRHIAKLVKLDYVKVVTAKNLPKLQGMTFNGVTIDHNTSGNTYFLNLNLQ